MFLPLKMMLPQELLLLHISPFLIEMAKRLRLCSEAVKLGWKQINLFLDSSQLVRLLILDVSQVVNPLKDDLKCI